jgi:DNA repair protein RecO (recombination protein O)
MQWTDEGIVLGVKRHGEAGGILELMTREHGRHLGMVRGAFSARLNPIVQPGNTVSATWRARLDEHLGNYTVEALNLRASSFFGSSHAIYGVGHLAALMRLLPERDPHEGLYAVFESLLEHLDDAGAVAPQVVRFELQLLSELGFGLDLEQCVATGATAELVYVRRSRAAQSRVRPASRGPTRCCGCQPSCARTTRCLPGAMSPTASRSPASSSPATCWSRAA